ncbi:MAG: Ig-like domain repeat protein [Terriglobales bacterium]
MGVVTRLLAFINLLFLLSSFGFAQVSPRILITKLVDETQLTTLMGNTHPLARAEFDQGAAPADLPMNRMLLVLKRSDEQETALRSLIDSQQDKTSPNYHQWLTPEAFGKQFGPSDQDMQQVILWLQSHGFQISRVSNGRTVIEFSGTAAQVQEALHTAIHKYAVNGEQHWANANDPQIPTALAPVVAGVDSLNNFPRTPMYRLAGIVSRSKSTGQMKPLQPLFTLPGGGCGVQSSDCYGVGPYDFATIYNVSSLWNGSPAVDGTGQTIAIVGETDINPQDVADFRNFFGLPALTGSQLNIIHNGPAPGILADGEETESDLDVEWSSAVAKGATIDFVVSESTETTAGIDLSAQYIIDNNLAPVMSESYGECELGLGSAGNSFYSQMWQQAAAEGITVFISSGDSGSAGCSNQNSAPPAPSLYGLAVSGFASTPYNVAVGGTDFNDLTNASAYWSLSNNSTTQASALSYIPETTWNDTCTNSVFGTLLGFSTNAETNCNNTQLQNFVSTVGGSGGKSNCTSSDGQHPASCAGGYRKPSWQSGSNVPQDGVRDVPDVSLFAAAGSPSGSFYIICEADQVSGNSCNPANPSTNFLGVGGTSASAPAFAGIMALVNQHTNSRQGNANYVFYKLAANQPGVFNDTPTGGTIAMPCLTGSPNCTTSVNGDQYGVQSGYSTGPGYDLATGLGSVNVSNLVNKWNTVSFNASTTTLNSLLPASITHGQAVNVNVRVTGSSGTPTGSVTLFGGPTGTQFIDSHILDTSGNALWASAFLPGGSYNVKAHYSGDGNYGSSDSAASAVVVNKENSSAQVDLVTFNPTTGQATISSSAIYGSPYILRVNILNSSGAACSNLQTGCPSGNVALKDNGSPLDGGTFSLNSLGYFEDQPIQLSGGSHSLQAVYAGDNSFNPSAPTVDAVTITPAPTTISGPSLNGPLTVGSLPQCVVTVRSQGSGVAPGGTITFSVNGAPVVGNIAYTPVAGGAAGGPYLAATLYATSSPFPKAGSYTLSASYSGDGNYGSSSGTGSNILVQFPQPLITFQSSAQSVPAGTVVTLTAEVISSSSTVAPTGTFVFSSSTFGQLPGTPTYTTVTDHSGNLDLQATLAYTVNATDIFSAHYSGDSNYPSGSAGSVQVAASGSDFNLTLPQSSLTVAKGQSSAVALLVGTQTGAAPVVFSTTPCAGLPAESTCSVSPSTVTATSSAQLTVTTTAPHSAAAKQANNRHISLWFTAIGVTSFGIFLFGAPTKKLNRRSVSSLIVLGLLAIGLGCGGGSNNNIGGGGLQTDPGTPSGSYAVTVTGTSGSVTHTVKFTLVVP